MYAMLALAVLLRFTVNESYFEWIRNVYVIDLVMFYLRILQLFLVEKHLGPKIIMIRRMVIQFKFSVIGFTRSSATAEGPGDALSYGRSDRPTHTDRQTHDDSIYCASTPSCGKKDHMTLTTPL